MKESVHYLVAYTVWRSIDDILKHRNNLDFFVWNEVYEQVWDRVYDQVAEQVRETLDEYK